MTPLENMANKFDLQNTFQQFGQNLTIYIKDAIVNQMGIFGKASTWGLVIFGTFGFIVLSLFIILVLTILIYRRSLRQNFSQADSSDDLPKQLKIRHLKKFEPNVGNQDHELCNLQLAEK